VFAALDFSEILGNPYVTAGLAAAVCVAVIKMADQWKDKKQATAQRVARGLRDIGLTEIPEACEEFARDANEQLWPRLAALAAKLEVPGGEIQLIMTIYEKTFAKMMEHPVAKLQMQPLVAKHMLGLIMDSRTKMDLLSASETLSALGSVELQKFLFSLGTDELEAAKTAFQEFVSLLKNKDRIDDVIIERAKKAIPQLMKDPAHAAALKELVNGPPSIDDQIAALQAKKAA
jgi:hypothetical protein